MYSYNLHFFQYCFYLYIIFLYFYIYHINIFFHKFLDSPICHSTHDELLGALKHETLILKCEVDASPAAESFHWTFNSSGEPSELPAKLHSSEVSLWPLYMNRQEQKWDLFSIIFCQSEMKFFFTKPKQEQKNLIIKDLFFNFTLAKNI